MTRFFRRSQPYPLTLDNLQNRPFGYLLADGNYTYISPEIDVASEVSVARRVLITTYEIELKNYTATEEAIRLLCTARLRPATLLELLAFGAAYPEPQRYHPIVAIGTSLLDDYNNTLVAYLGGCEHTRIVGTDWYDRQWGEDHRLLVTTISN